MPEGPEVSIYARQITEEFKGKKLTNVTFGEPSVAQSVITGFLPTISGKTLGRCDKKGKFLYMVFAANVNLTVNFGQSCFCQIAESDPKKFLACFDFEGKRLYFIENNRHQALFRLMSDEDLKKHLQALGYDVLGSNPLDRLTENIGRAIELIREKGKVQIGKVLSDPKQSIISGVGNYLRSEILHRSHVRPDTKVKDLTDVELRTILSNTIDICREVYKAGGAAESEFRDLHNKQGTWKFQVYKRETDNNGRKIEKVKLSDGKNAYYVV